MKNLIVTSIIAISFAPGALAAPSINCVDANGSARNKVFIRVNGDSLTFEVGYSYPLANGQASHVTANGNGGFLNQGNFMTFKGSFATVLELHPTARAGQFTGLLTGAIMSPDLDRVINYPLTCLALAK